MLHWLALPPRNLPFVGLFVFSPVLLVTRGLSRVRAITLAGVAYATTVLVFCAWLASTLVEFADASWIASTALLGAFCLFEGGRLALAFALLRFCRARPHFEPLLFASALVVIDSVYPQLLRWPLGVSIVSDLPWLQSAAWAGPSALSFTVGLASAALVLASHLPRGVARWWLAAYSAILATTLLFGHYRLRHPEVAERWLDVGVVQGGHPPMLKRRHPEVVWQHYSSITRELVDARPTVDFVVWSEAAVARPLELSLWGSLLQERLHGPFDVPLLLGVNLSSYDGSGSARLFNSAVVFERNGEACQGCRYDKQALVPFAETLPFGNVLRSLFPRAGRHSPAEFAQPVQIAGARVAAYICYESLDSDLVRRLVGGTRPAQLLVNITNDGWLGNSAGVDLHFALARLRAIEENRYLIRVAETGITAIVDSRGRVAQQLKPDRAGWTVGRAALVSDPSFYSRFGGAPLLVACTLVLLFACVARRRKSAVLPGVAEASGRSC